MRTIPLVKSYTNYELCFNFLKLKILLNFTKRNRFEFNKVVTNIKGKILLLRMLPVNDSYIDVETEIKYLYVLLNRISIRLHWCTFGVYKIEEKISLLYKEIEHRNILPKVEEYVNFLNVV
jgi:hypothetical protein